MTVEMTSELLGKREAIRATYRRDSGALLTVSLRTGDGVHPIASNTWGGDSAQFVEYFFAPLMICDWPRFPLEPGVKNVVDRSGCELATVTVLPLDSSSLDRSAGVLCATAVYSNGRTYSIEGPGTALNGWGFYQETTYDSPTHLMTIRMIIPHMQGTHRRYETVLQFDGKGWWKNAKAMRDGQILIEGRRE